MQLSLVTKMHANDETCKQLVLENIASVETGNTLAITDIARTMITEYCNEGKTYLLHLVILTQHNCVMFLFEYIYIHSLTLQRND